MVKKCHKRWRDGIGSLNTSLLWAALCDANNINIRQYNQITRSRKRVTGTFKVNGPFWGESYHFRDSLISKCSLISHNCRIIIYFPNQHIILTNSSKSIVPEESMSIWTKKEISFSFVTVQGKLNFVIFVWKIWYMSATLRGVFFLHWILSRCLCDNQRQPKGWKSTKIPSNYNRN